jgi:hypothetical protein
MGLPSGVFSATPTKQLEAMEVFKFIAKPGSSLATGSFPALLKPTLKTSGEIEGLELLEAQKGLESSEPIRESGLGASDLERLAQGGGSYLEDNHTPIKLL